MSDKKPDDVVLPCGCVIRYAVLDGQNTMTLIPCRRDCYVVAETLAEAEAQAKPVEYREAP